MVATSYAKDYGTPSTEIKFNQPSLLSTPYVFILSATIFHG